jgi:hypothetical protein
MGSKYFIKEIDDFIKLMHHKETKGRSSGQTPFTIKTKTASPKKTIFNPPKILPKFKKNHFCIKQLFSADPIM